MREWSGMFCHSADPQCTITERFPLGCSWLCRKDVRRARKMREKRGRAGESFEAIAVWVEMKKPEFSLTEAAGERRCHTQGMWNQTQRCDKEPSPALPALGSWITQCCCPFPGLWVLCQPCALSKGEQPLLSLHSEHPTPTNLHRHSQQHHKGHLFFLLFSPSSCNSVVL